MKLQLSLIPANYQKIKEVINHGSLELCHR